MIWLYLIIILLSVLFLYIKFVYTHWQRKGFPYIAPSIPFGNLGLVATRQASFGDNLYKLHQQSTDALVGIYLFFKPALLIRDAELIKHVLLTDFTSFHDRGVYCNPVHDPLSANIFSSPGERWKTIRTKLTPSFTSGKLKSMLPTIMVIGENLQKYVSPLADKGAIIEMKDLLSRYTLDIIGSVAFGLDVHTIENPNDDFRIIEKQVNDSNFTSVIRNIGLFLAPRLLEILNMSSMPEHVKQFTVSLVKDTIEHREKNNISRKDFLQSLIQLRNTGKINENNIWESETVAESLKSMTIEQCAAEVLLFYLAGFDTSSSAVSFCIFELARNPNLMRTLQQDIDAALERHNGIITYECIQDIPLLDRCIMEVVRKYPTLPLLNRICTKDFDVPNTNLKIEKGTPIVISLLGVLRDPEYFPEPEKFLPDRFLEGSKNYNQTAYIPFGDGPRSCIGFRLGRIVSKIGIILLLQKYNFECLDSREPEFDTHPITLMTKGGLKLRVTNRKSVPVA